MTHLFFVGSGQESLFREKANNFFFFFAFHLYFPSPVIGSLLEVSWEI